MGLLSEGNGLEAMRAGSVGGFTGSKGGGRLGKQVSRGRILLVRKGITDEGSRVHASTMTAAQLQSQVSRMDSPIVYEG